MKQRNSQVDNMKGILIFLVVFGHFLVAMRGTSGIISWLIILIYSFHMPAFLLIAGLFAKKVTLKKIGKLLGLYVVFQLLFMVFVQFTGYSQEIYVHFLNPIFHLWYLISLSLYYGMVLIAQKMKVKITLYFLIGTIILAFISRVIGTILLQENQAWLPLIYFLQRHFVFLPFFVGGYLVRDQGFVLLEKSRNMKAISKVVIVLLLCVCVGMPWINLQAFEYLVYGFVQSAGFSNSILTYCVMFAYQYLLATLCIVALCIFTPTKTGQLSQWGQQSLIIYLGHPLFFFIVYIFKDSFIGIPSIIILVVSVILSWITCYGLSEIGKRQHVI